MPGNERWKTALVSIGVVGAFFGALIGALSLITGRSPLSDDGAVSIYKEVGGHALSLRLYRPKDQEPGESRPAIVWFFGGAWQVGTVEQLADQAKHFTNRGLANVLVDYRTRSRHGTTPLESTRDARSAMRWIRSQADSLGIDADRIAAAGTSSGGQLAAACYLAEAPDESSDDRSVSPAPQALILFNPALDLDLPIVREHAGEALAKELLAVSPIHHLDSELPPTLILHGTADRIVPIDISQRFRDRAVELGVAEEQILLVPYPDRGHEFYHRLLEGGHDYRATLSEIEAFLRELGWLPAPDS